MVKNNFKMKQNIVIVIISSLLLSVSSKACDCVARKIENEVATTSTIIIGKFIFGKKLWEISEWSKVEPLWYYTGQFVVIKIFKASNLKVGDTLNITSDFSDCSTLYHNQETYLFFGNKIGKSAQSNTCSSTELLSNPTIKSKCKMIKRLLRTQHPS